MRDPTPPPDPDAARRRSELQRAVIRLHRALRAVVAGLEHDGAARRSTRSQLDLQVVAIGRMRAALADDALPRHVWSLGQAAMPVVPTLLDRAERADGLDGALLDEARAAVADLGVELTRVAEGR